MMILLMLFVGCTTTSPAVPSVELSPPVFPKIYPEPLEGGGFYITRDEAEQLYTFVKRYMFYVENLENIEYNEE